MRLPFRAISSELRDLQRGGDALVRRSSLSSLWKPTLSICPLAMLTAVDQRLDKGQGEEKGSRGSKGQDNWQGKARFGKGKVTKEGAIRSQIQYYLSDDNLDQDEFFRNLLRNDDGWLAVNPHIMSCNKIKALGATDTEILDALQGSSALEVDSELKRIRRRVPYQPRADKGQAKEKGSRGSKGRDKGQGKGKVHLNGDGKGNRGPASVLPTVPVYDRAGPCGYYIAGCCQRGDACTTQHSLDYAEAIREEWLDPGNVSKQQALKATAVDLLGPQDAGLLFPKVLSHKLQCRRPPQQTSDEDDLSDLGFQWSPDSGGTAQAALPQRRTRWSKAVAASEPSSSATTGSTQAIRYLLVFDLEGKYEIIEFPVMLVDAAAGKEIGRFQRFVRPAKLFEGCPVMDTCAVPFPQVLSEFSSWLVEKIGRGLPELARQDATDVAFVTCGDWDCKHIRTQCGICGVPFPGAFRQWINIKRTYSEAFGGEFRGMKSMLAKLRLLDHEGHPKHGFHHLGMHDVENIARCLIHLLDNGIQLEVNGW